MWAMKLCGEVYFIWGSNHEILSTATRTLFNNSPNETKQTKLFFEVRRDCSEKSTCIANKIVSLSLLLLQRCSEYPTSISSKRGWNSVVLKLIVWSSLPPKYSQFRMVLLTHSWDNINNYIHFLQLRSH